MPTKTKPSIIAYQDSIRRKMSEASLWEQYCCKMNLPTIRALNRRYRSAEKLHDLSHKLRMSILSQIHEKKAMKK